MDPIQQYPLALPFGSGEHQIEALEIDYREVTLAHILRANALPYRYASAELPETDPSAALLLACAIAGVPPIHLLQKGAMSFAAGRRLSRDFLSAFAPMENHEFEIGRFDWGDDVIKWDINELDVTYLAEHGDPVTHPSAGGFSFNPTSIIGYLDAMNGSHASSDLLEMKGGTACALIEQIGFELAFSPGSQPQDAQAEQVETKQAA